MPDKLLFAVSNSSASNKPEIQSYIIANEDEESYFISLIGDKANEKHSLFKVPKSSLYRCTNLFQDTMFGIDKDQLSESWDAFVKEAAKKALSKFNQMLLKPKGGSQQNQSAPQPHSEPQPLRLTASASTTSHEWYPKACVLTWEQVETELALWAAKVFPEESSLVSRRPKRS